MKLIPVLKAFLRFLPPKSSCEYCQPFIINGLFIVFIKSTLFLHTWTYSFALFCSALYHITDGLLLGINLLYSLCNSLKMPFILLNSILGHYFCHKGSHSLFFGIHPSSFPSLSLLSSSLILIVYIVFFPFTHRKIHSLMAHNPGTTKNMVSLRIKPIPT